MRALSIIISLAIFTIMSAVMINYTVVVQEPVNYCQQDTIFYCYTQE